MCPQVTLGLIKSGEDWISKKCVEPVNDLPPARRLLKLKFVIKMKEVDGVKVPHVRPVLNEFKGTGECTAEELYTPGMLHDTWRLLLCVFLGLLNKGLDYGSVVVDFKRAFLEGDADVAQEKWEGKTPFYVRVPAVWKRDIHTEFLKILKGLEGLRSSPIIWRETLNRFLKEHCNLKVSPVDPCLFLGQWEGLPVYASLHGDDLHLIAPTSWLKELISIIKSKFPLGREQWQVENEPLLFVGMEATVMQHEAWNARALPNGECVLERRDTLALG
jgi:hypothetical protein